MLPFLLALSLLAQATQVVSALVVGRLALANLSEAEVATWYIVSAALPFIGVFDFGIGQTAARLMAYGRTEKLDPGALNDLAMTVILVLLGICGVLFGLGVAAGAVALMSWGVEPLQLAGIGMLGTGSIIRIVANGMQGLLIGLNCLAAERLIRLAGSVLFCLCAWLFLAHRLGISGLCAAWLVQSIFCLAASVSMLSLRGLSLRRGRFRRGRALSLREPMLQNFFTALPGLFMFNAAVYVVAHTLDARAVIELSLMAQLFAGLALLAGLVPNTLIVSWAALWAGQRTVELRRSVRLALFLVALTLGAAVSVIGIHAKLVSSVFFGKPLLNGGAFVVSYLIVALLEGLGNCLASASIATGFVKFAAITWTSALAVLVLTWPLVHWLGLVGVPAALLLAQSMTCYQRNTRVGLARLAVSARERWQWLLLALAPVLILILLQFAVVIGSDQLNLAASFRLAGSVGAAALAAAFMLAVALRFRLVSVIEL